MNRANARDPAVAAGLLVALAAALWVFGSHLPDWVRAVVAYPVAAGLVRLVMQATFFRMTRRQSAVGFVGLALASVAYVVWIRPHVPATTWWLFGAVAALTTMCLLAGPYRPVDLTEPGDRRVTVTDFGRRPSLVEWEARDAGEVPFDVRLRSTPWHAAVDVSEAAADELAKRMRRVGATVEVHPMP